MSTIAFEAMIAGIFMMAKSILFQRQFFGEFFDFGGSTLATTTGNVLVFFMELAFAYIGVLFIKLPLALIKALFRDKR